MLLILCVFLILFEVLFYIVGNETYKTLNLFMSLKKPIFITIFYILSNSFIVYMIIGRYLPVKLHKVTAYFTGYCLSAFIYLLVYFIIASLLNLILRKVKFNFNIAAIILVPITLIVGTFLSLSPYVKKYDVKVNKDLNNEVKIALISDIHLGDVVDKSRLNKMVSEINSLNPDIVLIAGDLIDSNLDIVLDKDMLSSLKNLKSTYGTYLSLGNHDYYSGKYDKLAKTLNKYNVQTLRNESILVNNSFYLVGRDDESFNEDNSLKDMIKDIDTTKPAIVMDHNPGRIDESIKNNIDLQVSGHTHNGQLFPGNIITNLINKNGDGYKKFKNTNTIVSSGYGTWGPPIRTTSRSQIVLITMHN